MDPAGCVPAFSFCGPSDRQMSGQTHTGRAGRKQTGAPATRRQWLRGCLGRQGDGVTGKVGLLGAGPWLHCEGQVPGKGR